MFSIPFILRFTCMLALGLVCLLMCGCVSNSTLEDFKHQIRSDLSSIRENHDRDFGSLRSELAELESDIRTLRADMVRLTQSQTDIDADMQEWLSTSETKLGEMEDRVIEIRLELQRGRLEP